jgi:hypothetical protein
VVVVVRMNHDVKCAGGTRHQARQEQRPSPLCLPPDAVLYVLDPILGYLYNRSCLLRCSGATSRGSQALQRQGCCGKRLPGHTFPLLVASITKLGLLQVKQRAQGADVVIEVSVRQSFAECSEDENQH